jgi:predicted lysophospholipase L1 biosynthesis ABC-type transport system permease subunit
MLPFSLVQRRLRLVDGLLPAFALFLPGGLFPRPLAIAALLLPFVGDSGLLLRRLVGRPGGCLLRFAAMMNRAILWAVISSIAITVLVIVAFASALLHIQHELGVAFLFIVALAAFAVSLVEFAREVRIALNEFDHYG